MGNFINKVCGYIKSIMLTKSILNTSRKSINKSLFQAQRASFHSSAPLNEVMTVRDTVRIGMSDEMRRDKTFSLWEKKLDNIKVHIRSAKVCWTNLVLTEFGIPQLQKLDSQVLVSELVLWDFAQSLSS